MRLSIRPTALLATALVSLLAAACSVTTTEPPADGGTGPTPTGTSTGPGPTPSAGPNVIGAGGIAAWDALTDKDAIKAFPSLYLPGCSSVSTITSPLRPDTVTGVISRAKAPVAMASLARASERIA